MRFWPHSELQQLLIPHCLRLGLSVFLLNLLHCGQRLAAFADPQLGQAAVEALQEDAGLADVHAGDVAALLAAALGGEALLHGAADAHVLAGVDDVDDG